MGLEGVEAMAELLAVTSGRHVEDFVRLCEAPGHRGPQRPNTIEARNAGIEKELRAKQGLAGAKQSGVSGASRQKRIALGSSAPRRRMQETRNLPRQSRGYGGAKRKLDTSSQVELEARFLSKEAFECVNIVRYNLN